VQISALVALWVIFRRRRNWEEGFLFAALLGLFASIPALADGGPRVYAATQGLTAMVVAVGAAAIAAWFGRRLGRHRDRLVREGLGEQQASVSAVPLAFGALVLGLLATGIALSSNFAPVLPKASLPCAPGQVAIKARLLPGSYLNVVADDARIKTRVPAVRLSDFRRGIADYGGKLYGALKSEPAPFLFFNAHGMGANAPRWMIVPLAELPPVPALPAVLAICGRTDAPMTRALSWKVIEATANN